MAFLDHELPELVRLKLRSLAAPNRANQLFGALILILLIITASARPANAGPYSEITAPGGGAGDVEYRFLLNGFHFATLVDDEPEGRLIFRPHPDQSDPNGWGTSWYLSPFLAGGDPSRGVIQSLSPTATGIDLSLV